MNIPSAVQLVFWVAIIACYACISILLWICYRRTGNQGFVLLGGALLIWPLLGFAINSFVGFFVDQAILGHESWLFPFSMLGGPNPVMTVGDFLLLYKSAMTFFGVAITTVSLAVLARGRGMMADRLLPKNPISD